MERTKNTVKSIPPKPIEKIPIVDEEKKVVTREIPPVVETPKEKVVEEKVVVRPKLRYRVVGGVLYIFKTKFKKGDTFLAYPEQVPDIFKANVVCVSDPELQEEAKRVDKILSPNPPEYDIVEGLAKGWYNVVNRATKKAINDKTLHLVDAEKLRDALNA
jgi:hypothetical protein